jgi:hypothetical protein
MRLRRLGIWMATFGALVLVALVLVAPRVHAQQERVIVLVLDSGSARVNTDSIGRAIETTVGRPVVRMTDDRAPSATGRLTIAFSTPNRWVLRYEAEGQVAWVSDRITRPGELRNRLAALSGDLVARIEGTGEAEPQQNNPRRAVPRRTTDREWTENVILALQDEIVDPFERDGPSPRARPVSVLWSEVIDPFRELPARAPVSEVWSEVLDPWAGEVRR